MFKMMPVCRLMISCPSDVKTEVEIIQKVVDNINNSIGMSMDIFVKTLHWSKNVIPKAGDPPQSIINKQLVDKADAVIAIFGNKIGAPTQKYDSGTIEEIEEMIKQRKQVFVYFSEKPVKLSEINTDAVAQIKKFKETYKDRGIYVEYESDEEFSEIVSRNLTSYLTEQIANEANRINENTRFDSSIMDNAEVDILNDYTRFSEIKPVISFADPRLVKLNVHKDSFEVNIDLSGVEKTGNQEFAMALFEYTPCDNWSGFYDAQYFLECDIACSGGIRAVQLEVKDDIRNKIIDKMIEAGEDVEHCRIWLPSTTRDRAAWRKVGQICFTVFLNDLYMTGEKGAFTVRNMKMIPYKN